jgi:hypothetical protein
MHWGFMQRKICDNEGERRWSTQATKVCMVIGPETMGCCMGLKLGPEGLWGFNLRDGWMGWPRYEGGCGVEKFCVCCGFGKMMGLAMAVTNGWRVQEDRR